MSNEPIKFNTGRDGISSRRTDDVGTRPTGDPKGSKDFKRVLGKNVDDEEGSDDKVENVDEEGSGNSEVATLDKKRKPIASLFDLTSQNGKTTGTKDENEVAIESPSELYAKLSTKKSSGENEESMATTNSPVRKENFTTRFDTEQPDLSYVNPLGIANVQFNPASSVTPAQVIPGTHIQEIINQLVQKIAVLEVSGRSETTVTLKHPPLFNGVNLIVTAFDSAKGEFNISFENLTQAAKQVLDLQANQDSLRTALEQKGYAVHIITATTLIEHPQISTSSANPREQEREGGGGQQSQGRDRRREEEEA